MTCKKNLLYVSIAGEAVGFNPRRYEGTRDTGDDARWVENRLVELGLREALDYRRVYVHRSEAPPDPDWPDAVILGMCYGSINDGFEWQRAAMDWLASYRKTGKPILGICGGHQMLSRLLGAEVRPRARDGEPYAGSIAVSLTEAGREHFLFEGFGGRPKFLFGNLEHVVSPPEGATLLARAPDGAVAALDYGGNWVSVQFHPEMSYESMVAHYAETHPHVIANYEPLPEASRLLFNYLKGTGVLD